MDKINKLLLEALKASLGSQTVNWDFELQQEEWLRLFQRADMHHILPMIYEAVYNCPAAKKMDAAFFAPFRKKTIQQVMIQTMKTGEFLRLYQYLSEAGIKPVVVKGIICRELYPNPDFRSSGDEDLLIPPELFDVCHEKLLEYGMIPADSTQNIQESYEVPYGKPGSAIYIELHKSLFPPDSEAYGELNHFFTDVHKQMIEIPVQGTSIGTMDYTTHFFYLICHAFKHFLHSGFGIRQVCDMILFANRYGSEIDWQKVREGCRAIHGELFTAALLKIGEKYLTFSAEESHCPLEWRNLPVDEEALLEDLLSGGIYGSSNMSRQHSSNLTLYAVSADKAGSRSPKSILKTVFPSLKYMETRFPYLRKAPFLLPVAWVKRVLKYGKEMNTIEDNHAADSIKIGNQRIELMKRYGIIDGGKGKSRKKNGKRLDIGKERKRN